MNVRCYATALAVSILSTLGGSLAAYAADDGSAPENDQRISVSFDSHPKISSIVVDGIIYLPSQQPVPFSWLAGSVHTFGILSKEPVYESSNTRYVFDQWNDFDRGTPRTIEASDAIAGRQFIALFKQQHLLTVVSDYGVTSGAGWYDAGSTAEVKLQSSDTIEVTPDKVRMIFSGWNTGYAPRNPTNIVEMDMPAVVIAGWQEQYRLQVVNPEIGDGYVSGSGWYDKGTPATISAKDVADLPEQGRRLSFMQWDGAAGDNELVAEISNKFSSTATVIVNAPYVISPEWGELVHVRVNSDIGNPAGEGYYEKGAVATVSIDPFYEVEPEIVRLVFSGWQTATGVISSNQDKSNSISLRVSEPVTLTPIWSKQYSVKTESAFGMVEGGGWYDEGSTAIITIPQTTVNLGLGKNAIFEGWSGDEGGTVIAQANASPDRSLAIYHIDRPYEVQASWKIDNSLIYLLISTTFALAAGSIGYVIVTNRRRKMPKGMAET